MQKSAVINEECLVQKLSGFSECSI